MPESNSFSVGVDRLLQAIHPHGRPETSFPLAMGDEDSRRRSGERLNPWFVRMVDQFCAGEPRLAALEDNLAIFGRFQWEGGNRLLYANVQAIYTIGDLDVYYLGAPTEAIYLRLDFDYRTLGGLFSHPLAHVHVEGDLSPRFALEGGDNGNIIMDFLEFLYRTYAHDKWLAWVKREWSRHIASTRAGGTADPLPIILQAFESSRFRDLRSYATDLERIKRVLRRRKDELFKPRVDSSDRVLLEYPLAR